MMLTAMVACATFLILLLDSTPIAFAGAAVAALAAALAQSVIHEPAVERSWSVGPDGRVWVWWDAAATPHEASAAFVSPYLIVLGQDRRRLQVWRDSAPAAAFRRLSAAVRWGVRKDSSDASTKQLDATDRT